MSSFVERRLRRLSHKPRGFSRSRTDQFGDTAAFITYDTFTNELKDSGSQRQYAKLRSFTGCRRGFPGEASWSRVESRWREDCGKTANPLICLQRLTHRRHRKICRKAAVWVHDGTGYKLELGDMNRDSPGSISAVSTRFLGGPNLECNLFWVYIIYCTETHSFCFL